ncbi:MAG: YjiH family protein [Myxococcota bacterium]
MGPRTRFAASTLLGLGLFLAPLPYDGRWTVAFDLLVKVLQGGAPRLIDAWCMLLLLGGALASMVAHGRDGPHWRIFQAGPVLRATRGLGVVCAILLLTKTGPAWLIDPNVGGFLWSKLITAVAIIVPLGAVGLEIVASYGLLEWLGTWMRPIMRPLFRLPGRAALDDLMSWLGSYSVGLYLTHQLTMQGRYTRREAFVVVTGFSPVSIGFVGVVASTLDLLHLFPLIFGTYFVVVYALAALQARLWPTTGIPDTTLAEAAPEPPLEGALGIAAWQRALARAAASPPLPTLAWRGLRNGTLLAASILGTILTVGSLATALAEHTPVFVWLGAPLVPVLAWLGLPDAALAGPAVLAGITEMYVPALLVKDAALPTRFFICVLSISQLIFFSSVGPMMLDLFREVPIRLGHLVALFLFRTAVLLPVLAAWTAVLSAVGVLA